MSSAISVRVLGNVRTLSAHSWMKSSQARISARNASSLVIPRSFAVDSRVCTGSRMMKMYLASKNRDSKNAWVLRRSTVDRWNDVNAILSPTIG